VAAEIREASSVETTLIPGSGGIFTVVVDGNMIYDKGKTGGFPKPGEIAGLLKDA